MMDWGLEFSSTIAGSMSIVRQCLNISRASAGIFSDSIDIILSDLKRTFQVAYHHALLLPVHLIFQRKNWYETGFWLLHKEIHFNPFHLVGK
jgi:hypothetical protein